MASTSFSMTFFGKGYSSAAAAAGKVTTCGMPCSSYVWQTRSRDISALLCLTGAIMLVGGGGSSPLLACRCVYSPWWCHAPTGSVRFGGGDEG